MAWARLRSFYRNIVRRAELETHMSEELQFHLEQRVADLIARRGLSPEQALRTARREFGSVEQYKDEIRQSLGLRLLDELSGDIRYALRSLRKNKGFTVAAVATLALGIGANTAVFSVFHALFVRELPVRNPEELVVFDWLRTQDSMVAGYSGHGRPGPGPGVGIRTSFSVLTFEQFRTRSDTFSHVFAFAPIGDLNVVADRQADAASGLLVTGEYFAALGVPVLLGRTISADDDSSAAAPVAVISHTYWQRRFAGDPTIIGKAIDVNREPVVIVGVTPEGFHGPRMSESSDVTLPLAMASRLRGPGEAGPARPIWRWWIEIMARLQPGVTREQALANIQSAFVDTVRESWAARPADTQNPARTGIPQLRVRPGAQGPDAPRFDAQPILSLVFLVVVAILLIGCVNLANLLLVQAAARRQEMSVRLTLGASRGRVVRQLVTESLLLALGGGIAGAILAVWAKDFMMWLPSSDTPLVDARIDLRVLAFAAGLSAITALAFGVGPALRATRVDLGPWLKTGVRQGDGTRGIMTKALLSAQVAISLVLLVGAGLFVRTLFNFSQVDVGFNVDNLLVFRINPGIQGESASRTFDFYDRLMTEIEAVPGVQAATMSVMPVLARSEWEEGVRPDGVGEPRDVFIQIGRWNFLETMGVPLMMGRGLSPADTEGRPRVAVINESAARRIFADPNPVGRHFQFVKGPDRDVPIQVVGVVRDSKYASLEQPAPPTLFMPHRQVPPSAMTVEVRTASDPLEIAPIIREAVRRIEPGLPLVVMRTQRQQIAETIGMPRALALLTVASGMLALLLACVGLYGVVSYDATRRTNEIGIRMALGARRSDVQRLMMRQTLVVVMIGAAAGLGLALAGSQLIQSLLFGIGPTDPPTLATAVGLLTAVAFSAAYVPARRASRLEPTRALRYE